jgi:hypothetical protein
VGGARRRHPASGQTLVLFTAAIVVLLGVTAIVIDVSWYWANQLRVQRAADAAALAGAVQLPGAVLQGDTLALAAAGQNGYTQTISNNCVAGTKPYICALPDKQDRYQMDVEISAPVQTFFMGIFGIKTITADRKAEAEFHLPVPMGSPENYYGIYCLTKVTDPRCTDPGAPTVVDLVPDVNPAGPGGSCSTGPAAPPGYLCSKGFWGAAITKGGNQQNGDAYLPANNGGYSPANNVLYDPAGYSYTVEIPAGATGTVSIFDPTFCAVGGNGYGGYYGTGDHWIGGSTSAKVSTFYNLYNEVDPYNPANDGAAIATSGNLFAGGTTGLGELQSDQSGTYGTPQNTGITNCGANNTSLTAANGGFWHNKWWPLATLPAVGNQGDSPILYRLQVTTTKVDTTQAGGTIAVAGWTANDNTNAENMFGIEVTSSLGQPRVYGSGRMCAYNTLVGGAGGAAQDQNFYLAEVDAQGGAGKTLEIRLFDPGDVGGNATMYIIEPDGSKATFDYTADSNWIPNSDAQTGTNVNQLITAVNGASSFNNTWVTIDIPLPTSYNPSAGQDWWQIQYFVGDGNDTTTWEVNILGNPVHLIVP